MIIWLNGAFGAGKTTCAFELQRRLPGSFVYDPESIGYFLRHNTPQQIHKMDFQDHEQWRLFNYEMLKYLSKAYSGIIIAPMTLVKRQYYDEIIGRLLHEGSDLRHFILYASRATLLKRLSRRIERGDTWAKRQIDRCICAFDQEITEEKIPTDAMSVGQVVEEVASRCDLSLVPDRRNTIERFLDRYMVLIRHIRR